MTIKTKTKKCYCQTGKWCLLGDVLKDKKGIFVNPKNLFDATLPLICTKCKTLYKEIPYTGIKWKE